MLSKERQYVQRYKGEFRWNLNCLIISMHDPHEISKIIDKTFIGIYRADNLIILRSCYLTFPLIKGNGQWQMHGWIHVSLARMYFSSLMENLQRKTTRTCRPLLFYRTSLQKGLIINNLWVGRRHLNKKITKRMAWRSGITDLDNVVF